MATIWGLRRQIRKLREELDQMGREQNRTRQETERQYQRRIEQVQRELQQQVERSRREMDAQTTTRIRALREQLNAEMQAQVDAIREADREAQRQRQALLTQLEEINRQLLQDLRDMRNREEARATYGRQMAEELRREADGKVRDVDRLPHEFFCPGQLKIYREHLESAGMMYEKEMFEAAASTADASLAELEILEITVHELQAEWELLFRVYQRQVQRLLTEMQRFESETMRTPCGEFQLRDADRVYWSSGGYPPIRERILDAAKMLQETEQAGDLTAYLSSGSGVKGFQLTQLITETYRLADQFTAMTSCIRSERYFSDERYALGETAEKLLSDAGYTILHSDFRGDPVPEPLDCYDLEATINRVDTVRLSFLPQRKDGVAVRNVCILTVNDITVPNPAVIDQVADETRRLIQPGMEQTQIACFRAGDTSIDQTERQLVQVPDPALLAKRLERKYQG